MASNTPCGIVIGRQGGVRDERGCHLPEGHSGPHEFVSVDGDLYHWETDWECDCDHCRRCEGDYCIVYWPVGRASSRS